MSLAAVRIEDPYLPKKTKAVQIIDMSHDESERRRFRRVKSPVLCRPAGGLFRKASPAIQNISMGGLRVFSDDVYPVGDRLELELFLPDGESIVIITEVVWIETLPPNNPAAYDVGLKFVHCRPEALERLQKTLEPAEPITD